MRLLIHPDLYKTLGLSLNRPEMEMLIRATTLDISPSRGRFRLYATWDFSEGRGIVIVGETSEEIWQVFRVAQAYCQKILMVSRIVKARYGKPQTAPPSEETIQQTMHPAPLGFSELMDVLNQEAKS